MQRLPLLHHQLIGNVVLVYIADVLDRRLSHLLRHQQLDVAKPLIGIESLGRSLLPQIGDAIRARIVRREGEQ